MYCAYFDKEIFLVLQKKIENNYFHLSEDGKFAIYISSIQKEPILKKLDENYLIIMPFDYKKTFHMTFTSKKEAKLIFSLIKEMNIC